MDPTELLRLDLEALFTQNVCSVVVRSDFEAKAESVCRVAGWVMIDSEVCSCGVQQVYRVVSLLQIL